MSSWGLSLLLSLPFAVSRGRAITAFFVGALLLLLLLVMFHSMKWTRGTSPSLMLRKFLAWCRGFAPPFLFRKTQRAGEALLKQGEWLKVIDLYAKSFDFDGMIGSNPRIAIKNETILTHLDLLCQQVDFPFPEKQSGRLREDISDYFVVRTKYQTPSEYHGEQLRRPGNEDRFKEELSHFLEARLVGAYTEFFEEFLRRLRAHIEENGPFAPQPELLTEGLFGDPEQETDPFAQDEMETVDPFAGAAFGVNENILTPSYGPPPEVGSPEDNVSPFGVDDPVDPFRDQTGTIHRLSGPNDASSANDGTPGFPSAPAESFVSSPQSSPFDSSAPSMFPSSSPESGFASAPPSPSFASAPPSFSSSPPSPSPFSTSSSSPEQPEEATKVGQAPESPFPSSPPASPFGNPSSPPSGGGGFAPPTGESSPPSLTGGFPGLSGSSPFGSQPSPTGSFPGFGNSSNPFESKAGGSNSGSPFGSIASSSSSPFPSPTGSFQGFPTPGGDEEDS